MDENELAEAIREELLDVYNYGYRMGLARHGHSDAQPDDTIDQCVAAIFKLVASCNTS